MQSLAIEGESLPASRADEQERLPDGACIRRCLQVAAVFRTLDVIHLAIDYLSSNTGMSGHGCASVPG